jgi:type I restriction enzyme S subunit
MAIVWTAQASDIGRAGRADPDYFDPRVEEITAELHQMRAEPLGAHVQSASRGVSPDYESDGEVRVIKTANVRRFELGALPAQYVDQGFASANARALIPYGALLITATGVGSAGRTFVKLDHLPMLADGHVTIVAVDNLARAGYLCAYLQSPVGRQQLLRLRRGSSRQIEIYPEDILSVLVPRLTPERRRSISRRWLKAAERVRASAASMLDAERRIATFVQLDERATDRDSSDLAWSHDVAKLAASKRIDAEYARPTIQRLRKLVIDAGAVPLSALITSVNKGVQPERYVEDGPVRVIKSKDVGYPDLDLQACESTDDGEWPYYLKGGEVLLNATGEGTLGRAGVAPASACEERPTIPAVDLYVLEVDRSTVLPEYLALYMNSAIGRQLTTSLQTGSSGQQHIYPAHFPLIPVPLPRTRSGRPDLDWQRQTIAIADARRQALSAARAVATKLDDEFLATIGTSVDLSMLPV